MEMQRLKTCCQEILEWQSTGVLADGELRKYAASLTAVPEAYRLPVAEKNVAGWAMEFVIAQAR